MAIVKRYHQKNGKIKTRYQAQVYMNGIRVSYKTFSSKEKAVLWHQKEKNFLQGHPSELKKESMSYLFSDCLNLFEKQAIPILQKPTRETYRYGFRYLINSPLYYVKMQQLNAKHIHAWLFWLKKHPTAKTNSRKSFQTELKLLTTILHWYKNFVNEDFNVPITKQHKQSCYYKAVTPRCPDYFMRPKDAKKWIHWLKNNRHNPMYWKLATFMLLTGVRVCEVCAMKWDAIDLAEGTARVMRIIRWDFSSRKPELVNVTKTPSSTRLLVLSDDLIHTLKVMKKEDQTDGLLFKKENGEPLNYVTVQKVFNAGFKALELPWRSTHILRHSYATMALLATKDLVSVQASLGHKSSRMTERYAKAIALLTKDTAQKTSKAFGLFKNLPPM